MNDLILELHLLKENRIIKAKVPDRYTFRMLLEELGLREIKDVFYFSGSEFVDLDSDLASLGVQNWMAFYLF